MRFRPPSASSAGPPYWTATATYCKQAHPYLLLPSPSPKAIVDHRKIALTIANQAPSLHEKDMTGAASGCIPGVAVSSAHGDREKTGGHTRYAARDR